MRSVDLRRRGLPALAAVLLMAMLIAPQPAVHAGPGGQGNGARPESAWANTHRPLRAAQVRAAIAALVDKYGISEPEALRRLSLQREAYRLRDRLVARHADHYAGMWLDQDGGGTLVVAATNPRALQPALAGAADRARVRVVAAQRPWRELRATRDRITGRLGEPALGQGVDVGIDARTNTVRVRRPTRPLAPLAGVVDRAVRGEPPAAVAVSTYRPGEPKSATGTRGSGAAVDCQPLACDTPMRAGVRLDIQRDDRTWDGCTSGFNLTGADNGLDYVLTAGHCVWGRFHERADTTLHNGLPVGAEVVNGRIAAVVDSTWDYAVIPYAVHNGNSWASYWMHERSGRNRVVEFTGCARDPAAGNAAWKCDSFAHFMTGVEANPLDGSVACATGAGTGGQFGTGAPLDRIPGTRCGIAQFPGIIATTVSICSAPGDSGGPLYDPATDRAIGILHAGSAAVPGNTCKSPGTSTYHNVSFILERLPVDHGRRFALNTEF
jgi:hypothetical protein